MVEENKTQQEIFDDENEDIDKLQRRLEKALIKMNLKNENLKQGSIKELFKLPFGAISFGSSRGGKSTKIKQILQDPKYGILERIKADNIYIISPTQKFDETMKAIRNHLEARSKNVTDENFIEDIALSNTLVKNIIEGQKTKCEQKKELPHYLFIYDDCINEM